MNHNRNTVIEMRAMRVFASLVLFFFVLHKQTFNSLPRKIVFNRMQVEWKEMEIFAFGSFQHLKMGTMIFFRDVIFAIKKMFRNVEIYFIQEIDWILLLHVNQSFPLPSEMQRVPICSDCVSECVHALCKCVHTLIYRRKRIKREEHMYFQLDIESNRIYTCTNKNTRTCTHFLNGSILSSSDQIISCVMFFPFILSFILVIRFSMLTLDSR